MPPVRPNESNQTGNVEGLLEVPRSLEYSTLAGLADELNKQWPASLCPTASAAQAIACTALMRNNDAETLVATG